MVGYAAFAPFYDAVQGDRAEHAAYLRLLIEKNQPQAKRVLELACGTGSILKQLQPDYEVVGVDRSEEMLEIAAQKVPQARLVRGDMTTVDLGETFDVVLCVYDSINHLMRYEEWEAVFERARDHLAAGGVFIFDINTEQRLATLGAEAAVTQWFGDGNLLLIDVEGRGEGVYAWSIRVFEHVGDSEYRLHAEDILEVSFPADRITESLRQRYRRVSTHDARRARPTPRSDRLHFVCRR